MNVKWGEERNEAHFTKIHIMSVKLCVKMHVRLVLSRCRTKKNGATDKTKWMPSGFIFISSWCVLLATNAPATGGMALHSCRSTAKRISASQILKPRSVIYGMQTGFLWRNFSIHLSNQFQLTAA